MSRLIDADAFEVVTYTEFPEGYNDTFGDGVDWILEKIDAQPTIEPERKNIIEIPETGIGDLSDGYHTFNGLYEQRMVLFAALVKAYKEKAWKSYRHEDGEYCFGGGWFIVGIDTPEGSYTYHYENKYWDMFDCVDLPRSKHWDGHTEEDAETRLMSLEPERKKGKWIELTNTNHTYVCSVCGRMLVNITDGKNTVTKNYPFCHYGAYMGDKE